MHLDVIERLCCPAEHEESPLVATATRHSERRIIEGLLGCAVCRREYPIREAVADLRQARGITRHATASGWANDEATLRLAAQLDLSQPGRRVMLCGSYALIAPALSVMYDALCIAIGVAANAEGHVAAHASVLRIDTRVPLAAASLDGAAVDAAHAAVLSIEEVRALLRVNGRLVLPSHRPQPAGTVSLARDEREWVVARSADLVRLGGGQGVRAPRAGGEPTR
ncbi:MAG: hypothetical protein ACT4P6_04015 [Gemmatimonadaceae bacterium]